MGVFLFVFLFCLFYLFFMLFFYFLGCLSFMSFCLSSLSSILLLTCRPDPRDLNTSFTVLLPENWKAQKVNWWIHILVEDIFFVCYQYHLFLNWLVHFLVVYYLYFIDINLRIADYMKNISQNTFKLAVLLPQYFLWKVTCVIIHLKNIARIANAVQVTIWL